MGMKLTFEKSSKKNNGTCKIMVMNEFVYWHGNG